MGKRKTTLSKQPRKSSLPTEPVVKAIIQRIALGETMSAICREPEAPKEWDVRKRINQSSSLRSAYAHAREQRLERLAEDLLDLSDTPKPGHVMTEGPKGVEIRTADMIEHRRLQVDTRKWLLSRLLPSRYGDRVEQAHTGVVQVEHSISAKMIESLASLRARLPSIPSGSPAIDVTPADGGTGKA